MKGRLHDRRAARGSEQRAERDDKRDEADDPLLGQHLQKVVVGVFVDDPERPNRAAVVDSTRPKTVRCRCPG